MSDNAVPEVKGLDGYDISHEAWREYDFGGRVYRIDRPLFLYLRKGGSTHRIVDAEGVTHCCPAVGFNGCVLRWLNPDGGYVRF